MKGEDLKPVLSSYFKSMQINIHPLIMPPSVLERMDHKTGNGYAQMSFRIAKYWFGCFWGKQSVY